MLPKNQKYCIPEDFADRTYLDAYIDAFTSPEDLVLHVPENSFIRRIRSGLRMREYFRKAMGQIEQEEPILRGCYPPKP